MLAGSLRDLEWMQREHGRETTATRDGREDRRIRLRAWGWACDMERPELQTARTARWTLSSLQTSLQSGRGGASEAKERQR